MNTLPKSNLPTNKAGNISCLILVILSLLISGCQHTHNSPRKSVVSKNTDHTIPHKTETIDFGQYYLSLGSMTDEAILLEAKMRQNQERAGDINAGIQLALLYSLPNSPLHNVYTAKSALNKQLKNQINYGFAASDRALILLLKDQLNQQLYLIEQLIRYELKETENENKVDELSLKVDLLNEKITQLKKIEQAINKRGQ